MRGAPTGKLSEVRGSVNAVPRAHMPGPDVVGDRFAVAATADMSLSGELQFENGVLVPRA